MTGVTPAFWAKYRGKADPAIPLATAYNYTAYFYYAGVRLGLDPPSSVKAFGVFGPPQLTKENYIELNWTVPPGLTGIAITFQGVANPIYYTSNAAEGGTRDEGRYNILGSGVLQQ